ncbi:MAG: hypothetical protein AAGD18_14510 [Actinomycetota bacterium]
MTITDVDDDDVVDDARADGELVVDAAPGAEHGVRRFRQVCAAVVGVQSLVLVWMIRDGRLGVSYQGDEGVRVFDAYQNAFQHPNSLHGGVLEGARATVFGIHPPGDNLARSAVAWVLDLFGWSVGPVSTMFMLSIAAVGVAHLLAAEIARRAAGLAAGYLTLFLLLGSYVFSDIKVSSMGEAVAAPLLMTSLLLLVQGLQLGSPSHRQLVVAGLVFSCSTFVRPEVSLLLPGVCLALWMFIGFRSATIFGLFAGSFEFAKLANSVVFASDDQLSLLNVGARYHNDRRTLTEVWRSDFGQQLIREPGPVIFAVGVVASLVFVLMVRERRSLAWKTHLLVAGAVTSYLAINLGSQLLGLSPHASYRIVTVIGPLLVVMFSIAFVGIGSWSRPHLEARLGRTSVTYALVALVVVLCAWGASTFTTQRVDELAARVPEGVRASADELIARSAPDDATFIDPMRYWDNAMLGYFADRDAAVCNYARCSVSDPLAESLWAEARVDEPVAGTRSVAEFNTLRSHAFIANERPSHLVVAGGELREDWEATAGRIWGDDGELWSSHVYPYLLGTVDAEDPSEVFLQLGTISGVQYFEDWVLLVPRSVNDVGVIYEVVYDRRPDSVE